MAALFFEPFLGIGGLYYFNARYYDASTGRFINVDPIQDGSNWYVYCANNPLSMVDPTGLKDEEIDALTIPNETYLDYWIDRFDSGTKKGHEAALADLRASAGTYTEKFGSADAFFEALTDRFEQRIESTLLAEATSQGVPERLVAAVYLTEVGDGVGQYRWPSGNVIIGPPDGRGVFQIEPRWWGHLGTEKFTYSWSHNIKSGVGIVKDAYTSASNLFSKGSIWADSSKGETKAGEIAKGTYAIYNAGIDDWARPWNKIKDHRDTNFWNYYQNLVIE